MHVDVFTYFRRDGILADGGVFDLFFFEFCISKVLDVDSHYLVSQLHVFKLLACLVPVVAVKLFKRFKAHIILVERAPESQHSGLFRVKRLLEQINFLVQVYEHFKKSTVLFNAVLRCHFFLIRCNCLTLFSRTSLIKSTS